MRAIRAYAASASTDALEIELADIEAPRPGADDCVVEVRAAGVNPSDTKALLDLMPDLAWPRTPGRDFAGVVVEGPGRLLGREVWGSGGELGLQRDGSHAERIVVDRRAVSEKPHNLDMHQAATVGVAYVTAYAGLVEGARVRQGEVVAVLGANGRVGRAVLQLARLEGATVLSVRRGGERDDTHIDASREDLREALLARTEGRGADVVFNTVGSPYFEAASRSLAAGGRQVIIATPEPEVRLDIFAFYRGEHRLIGVNSLLHDSRACATTLEALAPAFESGRLVPAAPEEIEVRALADAAAAYRQALAGAPGQAIVLVPGA